MLYYSVSLGEYGDKEYFHYPKSSCIPINHSTPTPAFPTSRSDHWSRLPCVHVLEDFISPNMYFFFILVSFICLLNHPCCWTSQYFLLLIKLSNTKWQYPWLLDTSPTVTGAVWIRQNCLGHLSFSIENRERRWEAISHHSGFQAVSFPHSYCCDFRVSVKNNSRWGSAHCRAQFIKAPWRAGLVQRPCNPSTWEAEEGEPQVQGCPEPNLVF